MEKKMGKKRKFFIAWILLVMIVASVAAYGFWIEPQLLIVDQIDLSREASGIQPLKIVQFSDVHLGEFYSLKELEAVVEKINEQNPDMVVFTGDLMDIAYQYPFRDGIAGVLKKIKCPNKFAIYGNRDYGGGAVRFYQDIMKDADVGLLVNEHVTVEVENRQVSLYGLDDSILGKPSKSVDFGSNEGAYKVLLTHEPDAVDHYLASKFDLALSGHSHGGQVALPLWGPLVKNRMAKHYVKGLYSMNLGDLSQGESRWHYVNTGIGNTKHGFRLGNVPRIAVFTF